MANFLIQNNLDNLFICNKYYGDHKGDWVNEKSLTNPTSKNGIARLDAENVWKNLSEKINLQIQIFRLAGIYSNNFNIFKKTSEW